MTETKEKGILLSQEQNSRFVKMLKVIDIELSGIDNPKEFIDKSF